MCVVFPAHWALLYPQKSHLQQGFLFGNITSTSQPLIVNQRWPVEGKSMESCTWVLLDDVCYLSAYSESDLAVVCSIALTPSAHFTN